MVLWEMTLATAYFLGLKRTYKLALKIQRRLVSPKHPRIRQFLRGYYDGNMWSMVEARVSCYCMEKKVRRINSAILFKVLYNRPVSRRTRAVFDVAVKVHQNIQQRDIEVGRNLGNWILRSLDRMKPSAEILGHPNGTVTGMKMIKQVSNSSYMKNRASPRAVISQKFDRYMSITSSTYRWPRPFPTIAMIMRQPKPAGAGTMIQHRQHSSFGSNTTKTKHRNGSFDHVIRKDIMQWMLRN